MIVRFMKKTDLEGAATVHKLAFLRQKNSYQWMQCNLSASPRFLNFAAVINAQVIGYIIWVQKSGFRPEVILELEQLAVLPQFQGQGIAHQLIEKSLPLVESNLLLSQSSLKHIIVSTRADNYRAQHLYRETLGAEIETTIKNLYSADEVLMIARNIGKKV